METQIKNSWGLHSASYWLTALVALGIIFIGVRFILFPQSGAAGFGIPLSPNETALAYGRIKGIRDIFSGLVLLAFLFTRQRSSISIVFAIATMIPVSDCLTVLSVNGPTDLNHLLIHGVTAVYMGLTTILLFQKNNNH